MSPTMFIGDAFIDFDNEYKVEGDLLTDVVIPSSSRCFASKCLYEELHSAAKRVQHGE